MYLGLILSVAFEIVEAILDVEGGTLGSNAGAVESVVNISAGTVGEGFEAFGGSVVNISGGTVGENFFASSGSEVNLFRSEFSINGVLLDDVMLGQAFTIVDRVGNRTGPITLSGLLADGSAFNFDPYSGRPFSSGDGFAPDTTLTVTLVAAVLLGDINQDG